jgi:molybdenum cofactor guanylyltransferase
MRCTGVILAGGVASRYDGRAKGLELVGGRRIVDRVANALAVACDDLLLVANAADAATWLPGVRVERDVVQGRGSLGGLHAALVHADSPIVVVAWDMPFVVSSLLAKLRQVGEEEAPDAVLPESSESGAVEPMCAWYAPSSLPIICRRLDKGLLKLTSLAGALQARTLPYADVIRFGDADTLFMNVNTPADLAKAEEYVGGKRRRDERG